jgi:chromosome partitioning protein
MTYKIAVSNQKGGVGKTTVAMNVAGALADRGHDVLLVDLDPQGHATEGCGFTAAYDAESPTLFDILTDLDRIDRLDELVLEHEEFDVVPSNVDMFNAEPELTGAMRARQRLDIAFNHLTETHAYEFVIVDCPPALGILTDNALLACRNVLVPAQAEGTSIRALEILFDQIDSLVAAFDEEIGVVGVVANRVEVDGEAEEMMAWFRDTFGDGIPVWEVRKRVALKRAWANGRSIYTHDETCDMEAVFSEVADHLVSLANAEEVSA